MAKIFSVPAVFFYPFSPKRHFSTVVRIEREIDLSTARVLERPNNECGYTYCACSMSKYSASGYSLAVLATNLFLRKDRLEWIGKERMKTAVIYPKQAIQ